MNRLKIITLILINVVLLIGGVNLGFSDDPPQTISVGAAIATTGMAAPFGTGELNGVILATEEWNQKGGINGKTIELKVEDTNSTNLGTINAVTKLIKLNKVKFLLGPTWLDTFGGVLPVIEREGILSITASAAPPVYKNSPLQYQKVFSTWFNLEQEVKYLLQFMKSSGVKRVVFAIDNDPFFQAISHSAVNNIKELGMELVADESFTVGDKDFRTFLTKMRGKKPDGILFGFGDEGSLLAFLKQRAELLPEVRLYGTDYVDVFATTEAFRGLFDNTFFVSPQANDPDFKKKYQEKFRSEPVLSASTAYDSANILYSALAKVGEDQNKVAEFLSSMSHKTSTFGDVNFDSLEGVGKSDFIIKEVKNNEPVPLG